MSEQRLFFYSNRAFSGLCCQDLFIPLASPLSSPLTFLRLLWLQALSAHVPPPPRSAAAKTLCRALATYQPKICPFLTSIFATKVRATLHFSAPKLTCAGIVRRAIPR